MAVKSLKTSGIIDYEKSSSMLAGYSFQDFELIESIFIASTTASVTFNNLNLYATEYKHLQIRGVARTSFATNYDILLARFNGDSGSNYSAHNLLATYGNGTVSNGAANTSYTSPIICTGATNSSGYYGPFVVDVLDAFSTSKYKTTRSLSGIADGSTNRELRFSSGSWRNFSAISSITFYGESGSFLSGSKLSVYGVR